jgi:putative sterol carrier protein
MNIAELFTKIQERAARLTLAPDLTAKVAFDIGGAEPAQWHGRVEEGKAALFEGPGDETPDITVTATSEAAIALFEKRLNPLAAFMTGKVKVRGDSSKIGVIKKLIMGK